MKAGQEHGIGDLRNVGPCQYNQSIFLNRWWKQYKHSQKLGLETSLSFKS